MFITLNRFMLKGFVPTRPEEEELGLFGEDG
jgi:hypothetical protein